MPPKRAASTHASKKRKLSDEEPGSDSQARAHSELPDLDEDPEPRAKGRDSKKAKVDADAKGKAKAKAGTSKSGKAAVADASGAPSTTESPGAEGSAFAPNGQPTNKVVPAHLTFAPRAPGAIRIAAWNICGLAAAQKKGFKYYVEAENPDILVLTETKVNNEPVDPALAGRFPYRHWAIAEKKGYSGTAVLSKAKPLSVSTTLPGHPDPSSIKGRILTLEFTDYFLVATYVVNAGQELKTLDAKNEWNKHFTTYLRTLDNQKPVIWTGDLNVAPTEKDLANAKKNWNKTAGYTEAETTAFARILDPSHGADSASPDKESERGDEFVDVWRKLHPEDRHYTYFSYRFNCRMKGIGWRLDMFVLSERLVERVRMCEIRSEVYGASDHCPVVLEIAGEL